MWRVPRDLFHASEFGSLAEEIVDLLPGQSRALADVKSMIEPSASPRSRSQVATAIFSSRMTLGSRGVLRPCVRSSCRRVRQYDRCERR